MYEAPDIGLSIFPIPTAEQLNAISKETLLLVFDSHRLVKITRPRNAQDDEKAAQFLKAQLTLDSSGWASNTAEAEFLSVFFDCQIIFRPVQNPAVFGMLRVFKFRLP